MKINDVRDPIGRPIINKCAGSLLISRFPVKRPSTTTSLLFTGFLRWCWGVDWVRFRKNCFFFCWRKTVTFRRFWFEWNEVSTSARVRRERSPANWRADRFFSLPGLFACVCFFAHFLFPTPGVLIPRRETIDRPLDGRKIRSKTFDDRSFRHKSRFRGYFPSHVTVSNGHKRPGTSLLLDVVYKPVEPSCRTTSSTRSLFIYLFIRHDVD